MFNFKERDDFFYFSLSFNVYMKARKKPIDVEGGCYPVKRVNFDKVYDVIIPEVLK